MVVAALVVMPDRVAAEMAWRVTVEPVVLEDPVDLGSAVETVLSILPWRIHAPMRISVAMVGAVEPAELVVMAAITESVVD